jgi:hypothetical protein
MHEHERDFAMPNWLPLRTVLQDALLRIRQIYLALFRKHAAMVAKLINNQFMSAEQGKEPLFIISHDIKGKLAVEGYISRRVKRYIWNIFFHECG